VLPKNDEKKQKVEKSEFMENPEVLLQSFPVAHVAC